MALGGKQELKTAGKRFLLHPAAGYRIKAH